MVTALPRHGDDTATTWRRHADGIATTWRRRRRRRTAAML